MLLQGIGIALLVSQALIGVYSTVGVSWIFIYFRDSFITKQDRYRWAEPFDLYREGEPREERKQKEPAQLWAEVGDRGTGPGIGSRGAGTPGRFTDVGIQLTCVWLRGFTAPRSAWDTVGTPCGK